MKLKKISENIYEIPKEGKMLVPGRIFASEDLIDNIKEGKTLDQIKNVASLPGIKEASFAMPDAHQGYGFPIGGVAAFDLEKGVISPGGVGYDINCGVNFLATSLNKKDFISKRKEILHQLSRDIPSGLGRGGALKLSDKEIDDILEKGCAWALEKKYATKDDLDKTEDNGQLKGANSSKVSQKAKARGRDQIGTIGAGNHFLDIHVVEEIFDENAAKVFGLKKDQITIMIHCGSRGLGHQTASDYIQKMEKEFGIKHLVDKELVYAPLTSPLAKDYLAAMKAAANFAFVNRQLITHNARGSFKQFFPNVEIKTVYGITHNIAKIEEHIIDGKKQNLCVHRKGATRSFGAGREEIPLVYRKVGQPVLIPGSMGTASYVLVGTKKAEEISWGSTAHGAGRSKSRADAMKEISVEEVRESLKKQDILLKVGSLKRLPQEAPNAYKDIDKVVKVVDDLGICKKVAKLKPLAVLIG